MPPLRDVLCDRPHVLFVGINPSLMSARVGHHFAGRGNPFWRLLHAAGLVPEPIGCEDDARLCEWIIALTNVCPRATRSASELTTDELRRGSRRLRRKIERMRPAVVAFVGLSIYRQFFGREATSGPGEKPNEVSGARVFVVPNPSGLNAAFPGFRDKLVWYERLAHFTRDLRSDRCGAPGASPRDEPKEARKSRQSVQPSSDEKSASRPKRRRPD